MFRTSTQLMVIVCDLILCDTLVKMHNNYNIK